MAELVRELQDIQQNVCELCTQQQEILRWPGYGEPTTYPQEEFPQNQTTPLNN